MDEKGRASAENGMVESSATLNQRKKDFQANSRSQWKSANLAQTNNSDQKSRTFRRTQAMTTKEAFQDEKWANNERNRVLRRQAQ
jgi:hypothetical protein